jgi:hypothetical protein
MAKRMAGQSSNWHMKRIRLAKKNNTSMVESTTSKKVWSEVSRILSGNFVVEEMP